MSNSLAIHTHLGLGDHFIFNGLVRTIVETYGYDTYYLAVKEHNIPTVSAMFSDLDNLQIIRGIKTDHDVVRVCPKNIPILRVGFDYNFNGLNFDEAYYKQHNIPFEFKRSKFKIVRNKEKEKLCYDWYKPPEKYIFIHNIGSVGSFNLKIESCLPIITPTTLSFTVLDYLLLIENAQEIHCIDSSFMNMIDLCFYRSDGSMFYHDARKSIPATFSESWTTVKY